GGEASHLAFSPDGRLLATAHDQGKTGVLIVWERIDKRALHSLHLPGAAVTALGFTRDSRHLVATTEDLAQGGPDARPWAVHRWRPGGGRVVRRSPTPASYLSPGAELCGGIDHGHSRVVLRDVASGEERAAFRFRGGHFSVSPDGRTLALRT